MSNMTGKQIGSEKSLAKLDRATKDLLTAAMKGEGTDRINTLKEKFLSAHAEAIKTAEANLYSSKISTSVYGKASSSLPGLDQAGRDLAKAAGHLDDSIGPVVAVSEKKILERLGEEGLERARRGDLYGILTREPSESFTTSVPTQIRIAEEFSKDVDPNQIYLSGAQQEKSLFRKGIGVDFDRDPLHLHMVKGADASEEIKRFINQQTQMSRSYWEAQKRMSSFTIKNKAPRDVLSMSLSDTVKTNLSARYLEKGAIGSFSNEFKAIHIGVAKDVMSGMSPDLAAKTENLSHLFVENILKAKHQSTSALLNNEADYILDTLRNKNLSVNKRMEAMRGSFDKLVFGETGTEIGTRLRSWKGGRVEEISDIIESVGKGFNSKTAEYYASITSDEVFKGMIGSHDENIDDVIGFSRKMFEEGRVKPTVLGRVQNMKDSAGKVFKKLNTRFMKWGVLPAAAIGLAATLTDSDAKTLEVVKDTGRDHELQQEQNTVSHPKTVFDLPKMEKKRISIKGGAKESSAITKMSNKGDTRVRIVDDRSSMSKYTIDDLIKKGY